MAEPARRGRHCTLLLLALLLPAPAAGAQEPGDVGALPPRVLDLPARVLDLEARVVDVRPAAAGRARTVPSDVLFAFGSAELSPDAAGVLTGLGQEVARARGPVVVTGHTDGVGDDADNLVLSRQRADAVRSLLAGSASRARFEVVGRGESQPVAKEGGPDDAQARRLNRRVTVTLPG